MTKDYVINPDRFKNFFNELDTRRTLLTAFNNLNKQLFDHFASLEESLTQKSQTLDTQIESFKQNTETTLESLRNREDAIPEKEITLAARVQKLRDSSISEIEIGDCDSKSSLNSLRMWFRRMDTKGLMEYMVLNKKRFVELRTEIVISAMESVDLLGFVLESVEDFVNLKISDGNTERLAPTRCACGILIQAAFPIPCGDEPFCGEGVSRSLKDRAKTLLEKWKGVFSTDGDGMSSGDAIMFSTMAVGFGLKEDFDDEFLRSLVLEFGGRWDMAKLAVALLSGDKMKEIIEILVKMGKEVQAVYFASEAGLTDLFPPVQLLKTCLSNCQKITTSKDTPSREDINNELNTTKAIKKCIEDHKLESQFNISTLRKQITKLETVKSDKKKSTIPTPTTQPSSNKRSRPHRFDSAAARPPKTVKFSNSSSFRQRNRPQPPPTAARYPPSYGYPNHPAQVGGPYGGQGGYGGYNYPATYNL